MTHQLHLRDSPSSGEKLEDPPSTQDFRVRVSSEGDAEPTTSTLHPFNEEKLPGSDGKSLLTEFDEYVAAAAAERKGGESPRDLGLGLGLEVGDMVWGKVKSHPWWPGHIFNEAFASPMVRRTRREGHVLVAFFGDSSYGWFQPGELIPFDANFAEKSRQLNSRTFLKAVEEAVDEASRRCGLGLVCRCRNPENFRPANVEGYCDVDVPGYEAGVYSSGQIKKARDGFKPGEALAFVKQLAMAPHGGDHRSIGFAKNKATVFALRRAVFEQSDETYAQAFGVQQSRPSHLQANRFYQQPARGKCSFTSIIFLYMLFGSMESECGCKLIFYIN